jgi:uncharacterized protein YigE (DUF2233 family)
MFAPVLIALRLIAAVALMLAAGTAVARAQCEAHAVREATNTPCAARRHAAAISASFCATARARITARFPACCATLERKGETLVFAMNGGMYHPDYRPVGLFIENGVERARISTRRGPGNFHLQPNGVFFVGRNGVGVMETRAFQRQKPPATFATQSGPMLVINGAIHPRFSTDSDSRKIRNGVGVCADGRAVFAISEVPVTFHEFARLFRDRYKCQNALFLDGSISALYSKQLNRSDGWRPMGPIVGLVEKKK